MPTAQKAQTIDELTAKLRESKSAVLLDYRGLNVADISTLRHQLSEQDIEFTVTKNTLLRIAADRAQVAIAPDLLAGPTAVAFTSGDETAPAKLLTEFVRRNRVVSIKGGLIGGHSLNAEQMGRVAELPNRATLLGQLLGALQAPAALTLGAISAPGREMAGLLQALADKKEAAPA